MFWNNLGSVVAMIGLGLLLAATVDAKGRKKHRLATGTWGGQHLRIEVGTNSAAIEYDCAKGTIAGPLTLDSKGNFSWKGSHSVERGGPTRMGEPEGQPASYSGSVKGATMTLTVTLVNDSESIGTFTLTRGNPGKVFKCR